MKNRWLFSLLLLVVPSSLPAQNWEAVNHPVVYKNVTVYPIVARKPVALAQLYLTLDEAVARKEAEVTEVKPGLLRGNNARSSTDQYHLVLVNRSGKPILLLAGEVLAGGHQDRILSEDRIVPAHGDPISIDVLCAEQLRSSGPSTIFLSDGGHTDHGVQFNSSGTLMAAPSVRANASSGNQQETWSSIASATGASTFTIGEAATTGQPITFSGSSSYVSAEKSKGEQLTRESAEIETKFEKALASLNKDENVVGAVLVVGDKIMLADAFATPTLFRVYWKKLLKSYIVESKNSSEKEAHASFDKVKAFVEIEDGPYTAFVHPKEFSLAKTSEDSKTYTLRSLMEPGEPVIHFSRMR